jgi:hypothetical protein
LSALSRWRLARSSSQGEAARRHNRPQRKAPAAALRRSRFQRIAA